MAPRTDSTAHLRLVHQANDERHWHAVHGAWKDGQAVGERAGYVQGWRWGLVCGACACLAGVLLAGAACLVLGVQVVLPAWLPAVLAGLLP